MRIGEDLGEQVAYEVWREGPHGQVLVASNMSARTSLAYKRECDADTRDLPQFEFYRVRATTRRERVEET